MRGSYQSSVSEQIVPRAPALAVFPIVSCGRPVLGKIELVAEVGLFLVEHTLDGRTHALVRLSRRIELAVETAMQVISAFGAGLGPTCHSPLGHPRLAAFVTELHAVSALRFLRPCGLGFGGSQSFIIFIERVVCLILRRSRFCVWAGALHACGERRVVVVENGIADASQMAANGEGAGTVCRDSRSRRRGRTRRHLSGLRWRKASRGSRSRCSR